ncbi:MAG: MSHA biogenesis protein MshQ, partial [Gammaproteobacteria bacterium]
ANQANDPDDFVELKLLDSSIPLAIYGQWSIRVCELNAPGNNNDADGCSPVEPIGGFTDTTPPYLIIKDNNIGRFMNFKTGFDAILLDMNGDVIDYLTVSGYQPQEVASCTGSALPYDYQAGTPGASTKFIYRLPDGTGDWDSATSASQSPTEDTSNDDDGTNPSLSFSNITINQGTTTATITFTLDAAATATTILDFNTFDGSLFDGVDYTSVTTTATFGVGETSTTVNVPVSSTSNAGEFYFFVKINSASPGSANITNHVGTVFVIGQAIDHFEVDIAGSGNGSTCLDYEFVITAKDSSNITLNGYSGTISISTTSSHGNFSTVTATNNLSPNLDADDDGSVGYTFDPADMGTITLKLSNQHAETLKISVLDDPMTIATVSLSGDVTFAENVFTIVDNEPTVEPDNVPVAGKDHQYLIRLWRRDSGGICGVATDYDGSKTLRLWRDLDPLDAGINNPTFAAVPMPASELAASDLTITFNSGVAAATLSTSDVGRFTIEIKDDTGLFSDVDIVGTSLVQTVRPFAIGIDFSNLRDADFADNDFIDDSTGLDLSYADSVAGSVFSAAGSDFSITVEAVLWDLADDGDMNGIPNAGAYLGNNLPTPSFSQTVDTVTLSPSHLSPAAATLGSISVDAVAGGLFDDFTGGSQTALMTYSNVGIIRLDATITDGNYWGSGVNVTGFETNIGRFRPFQYAVTNSAVTSACTAVLPFTYARQPFDATVTIEAQNKAGGITDGYRDAFVTLDIPTELTIENSVTMAAYDTQTVSVTESFSTGTIASAVFDLELAWDMPLQGASTTQVTLTASTDEVTNVALSPVSLGSTDVRLGRLVLANTFGSELSDLTMPMVVEYFDGNNFITNSLDGCTAIVLDSTQYVQNLSGGSSTLTAGAVANGVMNIDLSAPGAGNTGDIVVTPTLSVAPNPMPWLQFDWDADGMFDDDPTATATFGIFGGNPVFIYRQQIYQE